LAALAALALEGLRGLEVVMNARGSGGMKEKIQA
jgi:hypothetical protein